MSLFQQRLKIANASLHRLNEGARLMLARMRELEIFGSIVVPESVDVMNVFVLSQRSPDDMLHHNAVLENGTPFTTDKNIPILAGVASSAPVRVSGSIEATVIGTAATCQPFAAKSIKDCFSRQSMRLANFVSRHALAIQRKQLLRADRPFVARRHPMILGAHRNACLNQTVPYRAAGQWNILRDALKALARLVSTDQVVRLNRGNGLKFHIPLYRIAVGR